jgi:hypothetical protein
MPSVWCGILPAPAGNLFPRQFSPPPVWTFPGHGNKKKEVFLHLPVFKHPVEYLKFRNTLFPVFLQPILFFKKLIRNLIRHPAVSFSQ